MNHEHPLDDIARFLKRLQWAAIALGLLWLLWLLSPILTPFVLAAMLAWLGDPLVDTPENVNSDPYNDGWMIRVEVANPGDLSDLMDQPAYARYVEEQAH